MFRAHLIAAFLVAAAVIHGRALADATAVSDEQWKATRDDARPGDFTTQIRVREEYLRFVDGVYVNLARLTLVQAGRWWAVRLDVPFLLTNRGGVGVAAGLSDLRPMFGVQPVNGTWFRVRAGIGAEFPTATDARLGNPTYRLTPRLALSAWPTRTLQLENDWFFTNSVTGIGGARQVQLLIEHNRARMLLPRRAYLELDPYLVVDMVAADRAPALNVAAELGGRLSAVSVGLRGSVHAAGPLREEWHVWLEVRVVFKRWLFVDPAAGGS
jgi:hypothetical protein